MWYISFHGGDDGVNNIRAYDDKGKLATKHVLAKCDDDPPRSELRKFAFGPDGDLYVVNGYKKYSQILRYKGKPNKDGGHDFVGVFVSKDTVAALVHPFSFTFDAFGFWYVSNQDTNVVTRLDAKGEPMPVSPYLAQTYPKNKLLPGTFIASSKGDLHGVPAAAPDVEPPQGLHVSVDKDSGKTTHSVRDVLIHWDCLVVADEPANAVKIYDGGTGKLITNIVNDRLLAAPVHLLSDDAAIYIGSTGTDAVLRYDLGSDSLGGFIEGIKSVSGISFGPDGCFYAASRKEQCILRYDANGKFIDKFIKDLPDDPEFLLYVPSVSGSGGGGVQ